MVTIAGIESPWTVADLANRFGPMPCWRICHDPPPRAATEADVEAQYAANKWLYELVDGVLVHKTASVLDSVLAGLIATSLNNFVRPRRLGYVLGASAMFRLKTGLVRIPDVSFITPGRLPDGRLPSVTIASLVPELVVEVINPSNTRQEMGEKLADYFAAGVRLVWYINSHDRTARVFSAIDASVPIGEGGTLDGGEILPGFVLPLREWFAEFAED